MKKIKIASILVVSLFGIGSAFASNAYLHGKATGPNVTMDFDGTYADVSVINDKFVSNVCNSGKDGFLLTGQVDRGSDGYVYFNEPDGDDTVDTCVGIYLSGNSFYLTGVGKTDSGEGYKMIFKNIKLIYNSSDKRFYFSGEAVDDALGIVNNWSNVYVTGINLIDWNKTLVDYSSLTGGNYANGNKQTIDLQLKDIGGNPVVTLSSIKVELVSNSPDLDNVIYLGTGDKTSVTLPVNDGIVSVPVYILKAVSNGNFSLKFSYSMPDIDGNYDHTISFSNINFKNPFKTTALSKLNTPIVGNDTTGTISLLFYSTGDIDVNNSQVAGYVSTISTYTFSGSNNFNTKDIKFNIIPADPDKTQSVISVTVTVNKEVLKFKDFSSSVTYNNGVNATSEIFADKRPDISKSFKGITFNQVFTGGDENNTFSFKPVLRDKNGFVIPDIKFTLKLQDNGNANTYSSWDCDEIQGGYQTNCKALQFKFNNILYSGAIDGKLGANFTYSVNGSNYLPVNIVSYIPVSGANLSFEISNIENTNSSWNFDNDSSWIDSSFNTSGEIKNLHFIPYVKIGLKGLGEQNFVDAGGNILFAVENTANFDVNTSGELSGTITKPTNGASFITGGKISWNSSIGGGNSFSKNIYIQFDLVFTYTDYVEFNYFDHIYYTLSNSKFGSVKLIPWAIFMDGLKGKYKLGGVYVNGLVNKTQRYMSSVKNSVTVSHGKIAANPKVITTNFAQVYNYLKKKAAILARSLVPSNNYTITTLNGGNTYYDCDGGVVNLALNQDYNGQNLLILKNCKLVISQNVLKANKNASLVIVSYVTNPVSINNKNYIDGLGNVYILSNVSDIYAGIVTNGSIFTVNGTNVSDINTDSNILMDGRANKINSKQLYIKGLLVSRNNIGGGLITDNKVVIGGGRKIDLNYLSDLNSNWGISSIKDVLNIAQMFDLSFARGYRYGSDGGYASDWISNYCKTHSNDIACNYPVIIEYDTAIKNNPLFK